MTSATQSPAEDTQPVLRIEPGMHTAAIKRISSDAAGQLALTVSVDKTARLWEVSTGRLIRVLRVPIGAGSEGELYCGALSPDGRLAAVGGWTSPDGTKASIYLFDPATGGLVRRIGGLPTYANDLVFSANGRYLAAVFYSGGLRVWESATGREVGSDSKYGNESYSVHWSGSDRLVTTCYDGQLRLYTLEDGVAGPQLNLIKETAVQGGKRPSSARFSPDGSKIAVGFDDSTAVAVVDGKDLSFRFAPDTSGVTNGNLFSVSWTNGGATLAAGGRWQSSDVFDFIRRWPQAGRGKPSDTPVARNTILDLRPSPQGRLLFCTFDPTWGVMAENGSSQTLGSSPIADYRGAGTDLVVSTNGESVGFGFEVFSKSSAQFSTLDRTLLTDPQAFKSLKGPLVSGLDITDWFNNTEPKLAGKPLPLVPYEESRSRAIAKDASLFLLGSSWYLHCFSSEGKQRWKIDAPGAAWAVNLADQDRLALAAFGDGTIRWYRVQDGKELLAFFPHADRKRWVLWTPEGYYDCSAGGEDLIGWHVNRGQDHEADFFPASKFRDQFYRPDVIQRVLSTRDVKQALAQANAERGRQAPQTTPKIGEVINRMQPPKIELTTGGTLGEVTLQPGAKDFTVYYRVRRGSSEPVERVLVYIDGRPVDSAHVEIPASDTEEASATTSIPEHDCVLALLAKNRFASSEPATLQLKRAPGDLNASLKPKVYLLAVGISRYANNDQLPNLNFADKDAQDFAAAFERQAQAGGLYQKVDVKVLTNEEATAKNILDGLDWIQHATTNKDFAIIFLSGHGENDQQLRFFFCPHDYDKEHPSSTGVSYAQISEAVDSIHGKLLFFIDACHAGNALGGLVFAKGDVRVDITKVVNQLSSAENGAIVFASSAGSQLSQELEQDKNGAFTKALVEGLDGQADLLHDGVVTVSSLETYVDERVRDLTNGSQTPTMAKPSTIPNYPIAVKK
jgi:WD40 repeat protein